MKYWLKVCPNPKYEEKLNKETFHPVLKKYSTKLLHFETSKYMKLLEIKTFCLGSKTRIYLIFGLEIEIGNQQV